MTHLPYHLVQELDLCGPVTTRWMYPIERYMKTLKGYVWNMARPEASMAEGYLKDECIGFVTEYLQRFDVVHKRVWDAEEEYGDAEEVVEGTGKTLYVDCCASQSCTSICINKHFCDATFVFVRAHILPCLPCK
jgi:hypothetical protein